MSTPQRPSTENGGNGLFALGALGVGALLMYLGDPQLGRRRRALLRDQCVHVTRKMQQGADLALRDASNRAAGTLASLRHRIEHHGEIPADDVLVARVRSALGRCTSHPHAIEVEAREGHVTLKGVALAEEAESILGTVRKVPGVVAVEDRLTLHEEAGHVSALQGGIHRDGPRAELLQENWSPAWRSLAGTIGAGLAIGGWIRGGITGLATGLLGGSLLARAATNQDLKSILGIGAACRGVVVQKSIHINAPVEHVFSHWTVENFPQWMAHVRQVKPIGDGRFHWVVDGPASVPVEWQAELTAAESNREISWRSLPGSMVDNAGRVCFTPEREGTRVEVTLCYIPVGGIVGHAVARALGADPKSRMDGDLMRFKAMIETGRPPHDAAVRRASALGMPPAEAPRH